MGKLILLIEDELAIRYIVGEILSRAGALMLEAGDAASALVLLESRRPDLIFMDLSLPDMDGLELLVEIKKRVPGVPFIAMSGRHHLLPTATDFGANGVLKKPFAKELLIRTVRASLA